MVNKETTRKAAAASQCDTDMPVWPKNSIDSKNNLGLHECENN